MADGPTFRLGRPPRGSETASAAAARSAALLTRLLIVSVIFQLAQKTALLQLLIEALQGRIDGFIGLNVNVNQVV